VYSVLTLGLFALVSPYFLYQALRHGKYIGSLSQRLGYLPVSFNVDGEESIWIHAVSVGEALTARALAADLKARYPRLRLFLSTTTIAGQQVARGRLSDHFGDRVSFALERGTVRAAGQADQARPSRGGHRHLQRDLDGFGAAGCAVTFRQLAGSNCSQTFCELRPAAVEVGPDGRR